MAKKSKKGRSRGRSRSRGRKLGAIDTQNLIGVVVGAVGSKMLDKIIPASLDPKLVAGGKVALGVFLPNFVRDGKTKKMLEGVGSGLIAVGSIDLLTQFGVLSGVSDDDLLAVNLEGTDDLPTVNGELEVLAGDDLDILAGDDLPTVNGDSDFIEA